MQHTSSIVLLKTDSYHGANFVVTGGAVSEDKVGIMAILALQSPSAMRLVSLLRRRLTRLYSTNLKGFATNKQYTCKYKSPVYS